MAWAQVAGRKATANAGGFSSTTLAFAGNVTAGDVLFAGGGFWDTSTGYTITLTDTRSTVWTVLKGTELSSLGGFFAPFLAYGVALSSGACTVTLAATGDSGSNYASFSIDEWSGGDTAALLDTNGGTSSGTSTAPSDSLTTATANCLILGVETHTNTGSGTIAITPNGSDTQIGEIESTANAPHSLVYRIVTSATSYTIGAWTLGESQAWRAQTAAFKEDTGGGGGTPAQNLFTLLGVGQ